MKSEEIRIAIAEYLGWTEIKFQPNPYEEKSFPDYWGLIRHQGNEYTTQHRVPNYPEDLNAMREAERGLVLTKYRCSLPRDVASNEANRYKDFLSKACGDYDPISATAPQRSRSFVRAIGKWKE